MKRGMDMTHWRAENTMGERESRYKQGTFLSIGKSKLLFNLKLYWSHYKGSALYENTLYFNFWSLLKQTVKFIIRSTYLV